MPRSRTPRRRATLASLAAELNVSRTTVSNAYNRPDQLSDELRVRILETARRLGYPGPDPLARSLRTRRANALGILIPDPLDTAFRDPLAVRFLEGFAGACDAEGKGLLILPVGDAAVAAQAVRGAAVDGFAVYSAASDDPLVAALRSCRAPVVVCDQPTDIGDASLVAIDDAGAMRRVAEHLIGLGHRRLAVLTPALGRDRSDRVVAPERLAAATRPVQTARIEAVVEVAREHGIPGRDIVVVERAEHSPEAGRSATEEALAQDPAVTAVIGTCDVLALGALAFARAGGYDVPGRLSITGFGGSEIAISAGLTTVVQPARDQGREAARLLLSPPTPGASSVVRLPTRLHLGATSGPLLAAGR